VKDVSVDAIAEVIQAVYGERHLLVDGRNAAVVVAERIAALPCCDYLTPAVSLDNFVYCAACDANLSLQQVRASGWLCTLCEGDGYVSLHGMDGKVCPACKGHRIRAAVPARGSA